MRAADARLFGAMGKANAAAAAIAFAPDVTSGRGNQQRLENLQPRQRFDQFGNAISIQINTAATDGKQLLHEMNRALRDQGSDVIIR
jgi:hypothetical protein